MYTADKVVEVIKKRSDQKCTQMGGAVRCGRGLRIRTSITIPINAAGSRGRREGGEKQGGEREVRGRSALVPASPTHVGLSGEALIAGHRCKIRVRNAGLSSAPAATLFRAPAGVRGVCGIFGPSAATACSRSSPVHGLRGKVAVSATTAAWHGATWRVA